MDKLFINEDISDWLEETMRDETIVESEQDVLELIDKGQHSAKIARSTIVSRELGKAPDDILRPNKVLITAGALHDISYMAKKVILDVEGKNGKTFEAPAFVGRIGRIPEFKDEEEIEEEAEPVEDKGPSYVRTQSTMGLNRAESYLMNTVPTHIWNRLLVVKANGGDVRMNAELLIDNIEQMIERLV